MSKTYETLMEGKQELKSAILKLEEMIISPTESYQRFQEGIFDVARAKLETIYNSLAVDDEDGHPTHTPEDEKLMAKIESLLGCCTTLLAGLHEKFI